MPAPLGSSGDKTGDQPQGATPGGPAGQGWGRMGWTARVCLAMLFWSLDPKETSLVVGWPPALSPT